MTTKSESVSSLIGKTLVLIAVLIFLVYRRINEVATDRNSAER